MKSEIYIVGLVCDRLPTNASGMWFSVLFLINTCFACMFQDNLKNAIPMDAAAAMEGSIYARVYVCALWQPARLSSSSSSMYASGTCYISLVCQWTARVTSSDQCNTRMKEAIIQKQISLALLRCTHANLARPRPAACCRLRNRKGEGHVESCCLLRLWLISI